MIRLTLDVVVMRDSDVFPGVGAVAQRIEDYLPGLAGGQPQKSFWHVNSVRAVGAGELAEWDL